MNFISEQHKKDAENLGIAVSHYDIDGNLIYAKPETLDYFIELLQFPTQSKSGRNNKLFDEVVVANENEPIRYDLSDSFFSHTASIKYQLFDEAGKKLSDGTFSPSQSNELNLSAQSYGYYALHLTQARKTYRVRLLVQPKTAYQPPVLADKKAWGLNVQLYSLRSERNWGIGDFGDLRYLIERAVGFGVDFIGINPLHLLYPSVPEWASPYSASSRRWLNFIYLDIPALPEFALCKTVQNWFSRQEAQIARLRQADLVDYEQITALKLTALELLFDFFKRSKSKKIIERRAQFAEFVKEQGEPLLYQGIFNVLDCEQHMAMPEDENQIGWLGWDSKWKTERKGLLELAERDTRANFYMWLQWITEQQLSELDQLCLDLGMKLGIYGDLAVQSSRGSADVWSDPELFCVNASVGAPPDPLGPVGQNWNLPPYNPSVLKARGFQPFIDMLRANMQHFGVLRIDHVMGLFRLWLIPENKTAADGVYVYYPFAELMAVLAIESQRNQCLIVGEDLGTVPDEVRLKLNEFRIFSYFVLYFEQRHYQFPTIDNFPPNAFATVGTHDVPSLASFWHCRDLELFGSLNVLEGEMLGQKYKQRVIDKQALLDSLHRDGYLPEDYWGDAMSMAMHDNLNRVIHRYLAESHSRLIGVQLENLIGQEVSFNLPGTSQEYPNWRKKLARSLEHIFNDEAVVSFLTLINQARNR